MKALIDAESTSSLVRSVCKQTGLKRPLLMYLAIREWAETHGNLGAKYVAGLELKTDHKCIDLGPALPSNFISI